jgi:hypothetical protein
MNLTVEQEEKSLKTCIVKKAKIPLSFLIALFFGSEQFSPNLNHILLGLEVLSTTFQNWEGVKRKLF